MIIFFQEAKQKRDEYRTNQYAKNVTNLDIDFSKPTANYLKLKTQREMHKLDQECIAFERAIDEKVEFETQKAKQLGGKGKSKAAIDNLNKQQDEMDGATNAKLMDIEQKLVTIIESIVDLKEEIKDVKNQLKPLQVVPAKLAKIESGTHILFIFLSALILSVNFSQSCMMMVMKGGQRQRRRRQQE